MGYKVYNVEDEHVAGDDQLDSVLKAAALLVSGYITDDSGEVVYESKPYLDRKAEQAEREASE